MEFSRYNPNVRVGNWLEDIKLEEEKLKDFLHKRERGELLVQKTRSLMCSLLREMSLGPADDKVRFGTTLQLLAPDAPAAPSGESQKYGVALSATMFPVDVDRGRLDDGCLLSGSQLLYPCARNTFILNSADGVDRKGEPLKFGQDFTLCLAGTKTNEPQLFVEARIPTITGDVGRSKHALVRLSSENTSYCRWKALYGDISKRMETEGTSIPPNYGVIISHGAANKNLAVEKDFWFMTLLGLECEISTHTYRDVHKAEVSESFWMFCTKRVDDFVPSSPGNLREKKPETGTYQENSSNPPKTLQDGTAKEACQNCPGPCNCTNA